VLPVEYCGSSTITTRDGPTDRHIVTVHDPVSHRFHGALWTFLVSLLAAVLLPVHAALG
jgi:hypothetical protein